MASDVSICNVALAHLGIDAIESLTEPSKAAKECKRVYEFVRDATLRDHDWGFARQQEVLALLDETRSGWDYVYAYPTNCIAARKIYNPTTTSIEINFDPETEQYRSTGDIPFETAVSADLSKKVILTNQSAAELIYTAKVTNANVYDPAFIEAFALHLASYLATPIKRDSKLKANLLNEYARKLGRAQVASANEGQKDVDNSSSFTRSRT